MKKLFQHLTKRTYLLLKRNLLTLKVILLISLMGAITWVILDYFQSQDIQQFFFAELTQELERKAQEDRAIFDHAVRSFQQSAKVIVSQQRFQTYISNPAWLTESDIKHYDNLPPWLPSASVMQAFFKARHALLIDSNGQVKEVYHHFPEAPSPSLLQPGSLLQKLSHNQTYMTMIENSPHILSSLPISDPNTEQVIVTLLLTSPIDDEFLKNVTADAAHPDELISLVGGEPQKVVASSNPDLIPAGTLVSSLENQYLMTGSSYFDYGDSDLSVGFASFVAISKAHHLANQILAKFHEQRLILALILVISFTLLTLWITQRIKHITQQVVAFSKEKLGLRFHQKGDEVVQLTLSIQQLQECITNTIEQANAFATGDYTHEIKLLSEQDQLGHALLKMTQALREVIEQANAIAAGDYHYQVTLLSDHDQLGHALLRMTQALREAATQTTRQDWLKTGQTQLHNQMTGEQDLVTLAKQIIHFLATYLDAAVGMFYLVTSTHRTTPRLKLLASYAYTQRNQLDNEFQFGEGLIGQVALECQPVVMTYVPKDYIPWEKPPLQQILAIPCPYENTLKGVIELGFFKEVTELQLDFLQQVMPSIGIAVHTAESRTQMQELLRRVR